MDKDSAHHANIAMHMYLSGDYINLVDAGKDYLDKPHLLFWLCALSYKLFGVTTFAYKFPSFVFTIAGTYSTFRLGKILYHKEVGKLSSLIIASALGFILANNDVRMDAILVACIAFATWQGVVFVKSKKLINVLGLALGMALGFSAKGPIAVATPAVGIFFYILYLRHWSFLWNWKWLFVLICFVLFVFPEIYCFYLQYNLHPEKFVRGKDHINGVKFILFGQGLDRFSGAAFGYVAKNNHFFFFHTFLWAFAPWSFLSYFVLWDRFKNFFTRKDEWLSPATFLFVALLVTLSAFRLPHYLNILFPSVAVMTSARLLSYKKEKVFFILQIIFSSLILIVVGIINVWAFPITGFWIPVGVVFLLSVLFYFLKSGFFSIRQKTVCLSVAAISLAFFLLNINFYPQLLKYQAGNELAKKIKGNVDPADIYFWGDNYSSSFNFYTISERKQFADSIFVKGKRPVWLLFEKHYAEEIQKAGYKIGVTYCCQSYPITKLSLSFINPATRNKTLTEIILGEVTEKK
jgi:4-amino-4-deoxy-L-arabinose transferase-like glycosyltransferase